VPNEATTGKDEVSLQLGAKGKSGLIPEANLHPEPLRDLQITSSFTYVGQNDRLSSDEPILQFKMCAMTNRP
jgi:hypothetical protein